MSNLKKLLAIRSRNKAKQGGPDFKKKILRDGSNLFRIVGDIHVQFEHWFTAADGTAVHSICSRNYDEELAGEEPKYCQVCEIYKDAWDIYNDPKEFTEEDVFEAAVMIGKEKAKGRKFANAWKAKEYAYLSVIDREDNWCEENDSCKVLCKSDSQSGISAGNNGILDEIIELADEYGDYEAYDIKLKKSGKKLDTDYRGYKDKERDLTDEEKEYKRFDFEEMFKVTEAKTVKRWLEVGVKKKKDDSEEGEESSEGQEQTEVKKDKKEKKEKEKKKEKAEEEKEEKKEKKTPTETKKTKVKLKTKKKEPEPEPEEEVAEEDKAECPGCGAVISINSDSCPKCGAEFEGVEEDGKEY